MNKKSIMIVALLLAGFGIAGCASNVVPVTPPAPFAEIPPPRPSAQHVWVSGHWKFQLGRNEQYGGGYIWIHGHWATPPNPGEVWVSDQWPPDRSMPEVPGHWATPPNPGEVWVPDKWSPPDRPAILASPGHPGSPGRPSDYAPGHWATPPHPGDIWVPDKWPRGDPNTLDKPNVPGHWESR